MHISYSLVPSILPYVISENYWHKLYNYLTVICMGVRGAVIIDSITVSFGVTFVLRVC